MVKQLTISKFSYVILKFQLTINFDRYKLIGRHHLNEYIEHFNHCLVQGHRMHPITNLLSLQVNLPISIMWYKGNHMELFFCVWIILLRMTLIHVVTCIITLSFVKDYINLFNHLPANNCMILVCGYDIQIILTILVLTCVFKYIHNTQILCKVHNQLFCYFC